MKPRDPVRRRTIVALAGAGLLATALFLPGCRLATGFRGPGWDAEHGVVLPGVGATVVVALTHGTIAAGRRADFEAFTDRIVASLPEQEGLVGWSLRRDLGGSEVWTMTVWRDGEAADDFLVSPAHREAMRASRDVFATTRLARVDWPTSELPPTWEQAEALLAASSRGG